MGCGEAAEDGPPPHTPSQGHGASARGRPPPGCAARMPARSAGSPYTARRGRPQKQRQGRAARAPRHRDGGRAAGAPRGAAGSRGRGARRPLSGGPRAGAPGEGRRGAAARGGGLTSPGTAPSTPSRCSGTARAAAGRRWTRGRYRQPTASRCTGCTPAPRPEG